MSRRAHPRSRGENTQAISCPPLRLGSSPLTRGKLINGAVGVVFEGLIPAHAGKTWTGSPQRPSSWAHPRSRGENSLDTRRWPWDHGSSPLTRGKPKLVHCYVTVAGLIPAHAGKTSAAAASCCVLRAHPRSRGENGCGRARACSALGSSPLTRGKLGDSEPSREARGLIPAHAGKTMPPRSPRRLARAHPRSRGENNLCPNPSFAYGGSSPLTRGKRSGLVYWAAQQRLIPAHAGKTAA